MTTKTAFVEALHAALGRLYPDRYPGGCVTAAQAQAISNTLTGAQGPKATHDGPAWVEAWRAIGMNGKPTRKGLIALPLE